MLFNELLSDFNKFVFGEARILEPINSTIKEVLQSKTINSLNLHDGKDHSGYIENLENAGKVKYLFNTAIGSQYAEFIIYSPRFYTTSRWVRDMDTSTVVTIKINLYKIEQAAINNWRKKHNSINVATVSFNDVENYDNTLQFDLKAHFDRRHESDDIEVIVKGKADPNAPRLFSKFGKFFKEIDFKYFLDCRWRDVHSMDNFDAIEEQQEAYKDFINASKQKNKASDNQQKKSGSSNTNNKKTDNSTKSSQTNDHKNNTNKETSSNKNYDEAPPAEERFTSTDYYLILGVKEDATIEEIRKSYRQKMMQNHSDKTDDPYLNEIAKKLNVSYGVLSDAKKRKDYDRYLSSHKDNQFSR